MVKRRLEDLPRVEVTTRAALRRWLTKHWQQASSVWVVTYKKGAAKPRVAYDIVVEELLCFGWIDSLPRALTARRGRFQLRQLATWIPTDHWVARGRSQLTADPA